MLRSSLFHGSLNLSNLLLFLLLMKSSKNRFHSSHAKIVSLVQNKERGAKWAIKNIYLFCNLSYATLLMIYCSHRWIFTAIVATATRSCLTNEGINLTRKFWTRLLYCCTSSITHILIYECKFSRDGCTKNRILSLWDFNLLLKWCVIFLNKHDKVQLFSF